MVECELTKIHYRLGKDNKKLRDQKYLGNNAQGQIELKLKQPVIATSYSAIDSMGRFVVIFNNSPILVGKIESAQ